MRAKSMMLLTFLGAIGCASRNSPAAQARATATKPEVSTVDPAPATPAETMAEAEQAYDSQLAATRGGQFDVDRQVSVLREAVLLYKQFLERADGRPEFEPAIRKSHERIADANATIEFLLASLKASREPPPPKTQ